MTAVLNIRPNGGGSRARVISDSASALSDRTQTRRAGMDKSYRKFFAERWGVFCRENFQSPVHLAVCFNVSAKTAENWWWGLHAPSGFVVAQTFMSRELEPAARKHLDPEGGDEAA